LVYGSVPVQFTVADPLMEILQLLKDNNIPLNRLVDVRSNPMLRQQIQVIVAVGQQPAPHHDLRSGKEGR
jgi:hypothetical protein